MRGFAWQATMYSKRENFQSQKRSVSREARVSEQGGTTSSAPTFAGADGAFHCTPGDCSGKPHGGLAISAVFVKPPALPLSVFPQIRPWGSRITLSA